MTAPLIQSLLVRAIDIANQAHAKQVDKSEQPYILHPLAVMQMMETTEEKIVAVLHDVIEDNKDWSYDLLSEIFPAWVMDALNAITKREGEMYQTYLDRVALNRIARKVKIADLKHNLDLNRMPATIEQKDMDRWNKYRFALKYLSAV